MGGGELLAVAGTTIGLSWTLVQGGLRHVTESACVCGALARQSVRIVCDVFQDCSIGDQCSGVEPSAFDFYWPYWFTLGLGVDARWL